jgi:hypothetical protein
MSADIASVDGPDADRTAAHAENERTAAAMGFPYPEPTRTLRCTYGGIRYELRAAILSWRVPADDCLFCLRCGYDLDVIAPNLLHSSTPLASCRCSSCFMTPVDDRDRALLELAYPVSEGDAKLGERFHREINRLFTATDSSEEPNSEGVKTREGTA